MKEIDLGLLAQRLWDAEETETLPPPPVSDYVMQHIFQPLSQNKPVLFAELDFTAFDASELEVLEEYLGEVCTVQRELYWASSFGSKWSKHISHCADAEK